MQIDRVRALFSDLPRLRYGSMVPDDTRRWAEMVRGVVRRHLDLDSIKPLTVVGSTKFRRGSLWVEDYEFEAPGRLSFRGTFMRSEGQDRHPAVLVCAGRNATLAKTTGAEQPDYPDRNVAQQLAEAGFASLTLDYGFVGQWDSSVLAGRDETNLLSLALGLVGRSPLELLVEDALRGLAWLERQPSIDSARLGLFGHSLGAHVALHIALACGRPIPTSLASFLLPYQSMFVGLASACGAHTLPGIYRTADLPDLVAALVPAPLQVQIGATDNIIPAGESERAAATVRRSYQDAGLEDKLDIHIASMGHGTDIKQLTRFFEKHNAKSSNGVERMAIRVPAAKVHFDFHARREILDRIDESLSNGSLTLGPNCARLEELAKQWTGSSIVVATNAGTSALEIALRIVNVKDRIVLVPANTFFATALAAMHAGAEVRFVDIELDGLGMDPSELRQALNQYSSVAAVILVHVGGIVAPSIHEVASLCRERGIPVIEDAAHALGSSLNGVLAGSFGDFAAFSMYPTKIVTSAEGGFLTCQSQESAQIARSLRDQGKESFAANIHSRLGYNWRMSEVHASIGIAHFERLKEFLDSRRKYAERYDALLDDCRGIRRFPLPARSQSNYYKYIAYLQSGIDRDALKVNLRKGYGVQLSGEVYEIPCCAQPYYGNTYGPEQFPRAYEFCRLHICLPVFSTLKPEQQNLTVGALSAEIGKASRVAEAF